MNEIYFKLRKHGFLERFIISVRGIGRLQGNLRLSRNDANKSAVFEKFSKMANFWGVYCRHAPMSVRVDVATYRGAPWWLFEYQPVA